MLRSSVCLLVCGTFGFGLLVLAVKTAVRLHCTHVFTDTLGNRVGMACRGSRLVFKKKTACKYEKCLVPASTDFHDAHF